MHKAIAFCRRSSNMQDQSLEDQKILLANWTTSASIIKEMDIDPEILRFVMYTGTGTQIGAAFMAILEEVQAGLNDYQFVLVEKLDRIHGRMGDQLLPHLRLLKDHGVFVIDTSSGEICNTFDNFARNIRTFLDLEVSREESRKLASRMIDRGKVKAGDGWWQGGNPMFGYIRMETSPEGGELEPLELGVQSREHNRVRLVLDSPDKVKAVQYVFEQYSRGVSLRTLVGWLNGKGFRTSRGNPWSRSSVQNILKNPIYKGDLTWGKRRQGIFSRDENLWNDTQNSWHHDSDKWVVYHDEKLRIVSDNLFDSIHARMAKQTREYGGLVHPPKFALLDKLLYCENCDSRYYYREEKRGNYLLKRYREYGRNRAVNCKGRVILARTLHEYAEILIDSLIEPEVLSSAFDRAREIVSADSGLDVTLEKSLEPEIKKLEMEEKNLIKVLKAAPNSRGLIVELNKVCDRLEQLRLARDQIKNGELSIDLKSIDDLERESLSFGEIWSRGSAENRQRVARAFIQKVEISKDRSTAIWEYRSTPDTKCRIQCRGGDSNPHILADTGF